MAITARHALVTSGSRGIGRGIALKLADHGVHVAISYVKDEESAKATLQQVRSRGADGFTVQADSSEPAQVEPLFGRVRSEFESLDIFVANARPEVGAFYQPPMSIGLEQMGRGDEFPSEIISYRRPGGGQADARQRPDHCHLLCAGRPVRLLAVVGRDGGRQVGA